MIENHVLVKWYFSRDGIFRVFRESHPVQKRTWDVKCDM